MESGRSGDYGRTLLDGDGLTGLIIRRIIGICGQWGGQYRRDDKNGRKRAYESSTMA